MDTVILEIDEDRRPGGGDRDPDKDAHAEEPGDEDEDSGSTWQRVGDTVFYQCTQCPLMSLSGEAVSRHWTKEHKPKSLLCPGCGDSFPSQTTLKTHLSLHHKMTKAHSDTLVKNLLKELTDAPSSSQAQDRKRRPPDSETPPETKNLIPLDLSKNLSPATPAPEPPAESETIQRSKIAAVKKVNTDSRTKRKTAPVPPPPVRFSGDERDAFDERGFKCGVRECNVRLKDPEKLDFHRSCHLDGGRELRCPRCERTFLTSITLHGHLWIDHRVDLELHSCERCDYRTPSQNSLNVHRKTHAPDKGHPCPLCLKRFKNAKQLDRHRALHGADGNVRRFVCEICDNSLSSRSKLLRHVEAVHRKLKPFRCGLCDYTAANNWSLRLHSRTHSGDRSFECSECPFKTSLAESLKRHSRTHSEEKRYSCELCSYACIQSTTLKIHVKTKHPEAKTSMTYECDRCAFSTVNREKYQTHASTHTEKIKNAEESGSGDAKGAIAGGDRQTYKIAVADRDKLIDKSLVTDLLNYRNAFDYAIVRTEPASTPEENNYGCELPNEGETYPGGGSPNAEPVSYAPPESRQDLPMDMYDFAIGDPIRAVENSESMNILNKVLLRPNSYESETTAMSEPQNSSSPIVIDGDSIRLNSPICVETTRADSGAAPIPNHSSGKSCSPLLPLPVSGGGNRTSATDSGTVRKKPKISVKSNLLLKGPGNLNPFHQQLTCKAINSLLSLRNQTPPKDTSVTQADKAITLTLKPTDELTSQDNSNSFLQNGNMILPNFPFTSNYTFGDEPVLDDIALPTDIEPPFISDEGLDGQNNILPGLMIPPSSNMKLEKPYMNGHLMIQERYSENILSGELSDMRMPVQIPMKFENKIHALPQQNIQDYFFDSVNNVAMESLTSMDELPTSFENSDPLPVYDGFYNGEISSDAGDERKIIILDDTSCDTKASSMINFETKTGFGFENKVFSPATSNPWKQNLMLPSFIRLSDERNANSAHNGQGLNPIGDQMFTDQYENQSYAEVFTS